MKIEDFSKTVWISDEIFVKFPNETSEIEKKRKLAKRTQINQSWLRRFALPLLQHILGVCSEWDVLLTSARAQQHHVEQCQQVNTLDQTTHVCVDGFGTRLNDNSQVYHCLFMSVLESLESDPGFSRWGSAMPMTPYGRPRWEYSRRLVRKLTSEWRHSRNWRRFQTIWIRQIGEKVNVALDFLTFHVQCRHKWDRALYKCKWWVIFFSIQHFLFYGWAIAWLVSSVCWPWFWQVLKITFS